MKIGIVGLGIVGLSTVVKLAGQGHDVYGFEQFDPLHARGSSHGDTRIFRRYPFEGEVYVDLAAKAYEGWQQWSAEASAPLLVTSGGFHAAPQDSKYIQNPAAFERAHGREPELISAADCNKRWPIFNIPDDFAVIVQKENGCIQPDLTRRFLVEKAGKLGAQLRFNHAVNIDTDKTTIDGEAYDTILITAGPWLSKLVPQLAQHLTVERRVLAYYQPTVEVSLAQLPTFRIGTEFYGMPTPDGTVKVGMNDHFHEVVDPNDVREPERRDQSLINTNAQQYLANVEAEPYKLARCLYTMTPDEDFIVDRHPQNDRIFVMSCCSGHGFKYGPAYGDLASDLISGKDNSALQAFSLSRFQ